MPDLIVLNPVELVVLEVYYYNSELPLLIFYLIVANIFFFNSIKMFLSYFQGYQFHIDSLYLPFSTFLDKLHDL
jgi:hypothetical protein